jgi:hypothetical protein
MDVQKKVPGDPSNPHPSVKFFRMVRICITALIAAH